jgi:hypothetical protein
LFIYVKNRRVIGLTFQRFAEDVLSKNPVIVVGSGTSCGAGISGMGALGNYLIQNISTDDFDESDLEKWDIFKEKISEQLGLEEVLQSLGNVSDRFTNSIVRTTWQCIMGDEKNPLIKIANGEDIIGFTRLFRRFKSSTNDCINVITTNYDHLIEISAATENWEVWDGFGNGILSRPMHASVFKTRMKKQIRGGSRPQFENIKHVKVYKPHGSLSWFRQSDNSFVKIPSISSEYIDNMKMMGISPVIVTPGIGKYLETHYEPYNNVMAEMASSIQDARAMIFLGFGFNDIHIQASFQSVLRNDNIPKLIATRSLTTTFKSLIERGEIKNFYATEKYEEGSRIITDHQPGVVYNTADEVWSLKGLLNITWGVERF